MTAAAAAFPLNHAHMLLRRLISLNPKTGPAHHYLYVVGESVQSRHDTDRESLFRQESNFAWLTGASFRCLEARCVELMAEDRMRGSWSCDDNQRRV